ncbi:MAG: hypothetical protein Q9190_005617, partial [Brigantiaea leucoxantha]
MSTTEAHHPTLRTFATDSSHPDDHALRSIFDSRSFWKDFSATTTGPKKGLFQNRYLTHPDGFLEFSRRTVDRCQSIAATVIHASSRDQFRSIPSQLDRLSDSLCRVLDVADFVRMTHPDHAFQEAATDAYSMLFEYMNVLNTTPELKVQLETAAANPEVSALWNEEETMVARILLKDFSRSAIDLSQERRQSFVELSNRVNQLGQSFVRNISSAKSDVSLQHWQLKGMNPVLLHQAAKRTFGGLSIPTVGTVAIAALRSLKDESARRELYVAGRTAPRSQLQTLEEFLQTRAQVAALSGYASYAKMNLSDKLAGTPEAVNLFLQTLLQNNKPRVESEVHQMAQLKSLESLDGSQGHPIGGWDKEYYRSQLIAQKRSKARKPDFLSAYFSLGTVMQGLSRLFNHLYGIRFVPTTTAPGETWNSDVRRLDVFDENQGRIAVLYCDLFARGGKSSNPAHFTLRCSRRISPGEIEEAAHLHPNLDPVQAASDGMATSRNDSTNEIYQLPAIALICDFEPPPPSHHHSNQSEQEPTLLSFRDVQTLFHEMGHAIHSFLGRTAFQVVSGTRCATDFAELPSVLMEYFASDASVLNLFARHWRTGAPLPHSMVSERLAIDRIGEGMETETQILLAMLDQAYHGEEIIRPNNKPKNLDSTRILHDIYARHGTVAEPPETSAQGMFGHLVEYGGT